MKLFLTGGTGFFGKALLRHWHVQQLAGLPVPEVCVLSRSSERFLAAHPEYSKLSWLRFVAGDVLAPQSLPQGERFSHILHAAADSTLGPQLKPLAQYDQIVQGTRNLLQFAVQTAAKRFLFVSSGAVYGRQPDHLSLIPEDWHGMPDPQAPSSAYGVAKRAAEHLCALYQNAYGIETVVARCFAFVGQDLPLDVHFAIGNFIRDALSADIITVRGNGLPSRSFMDQTDLACWLLALIEQGRSGQAYNVGSPEAISIADLAQLVGNLISPSKPIHILGQPFADGPRDRYVPDVSKAMGELGLVNKVSLANAIAHAAAAHSNKGHPRGTL
jgi:dTDP-glucose 4,6-dehydratase